MIREWVQLTTLPMQPSLDFWKITGALMLSRDVTQSGPVSILVVHGALGSAEQMEPVAAELSDLGSVTNVDLPGHGSSPLGPEQSFSIDGFADALQDALMESLPTSDATAGAHSTRPWVFGYSMGGYIALALEARNPGRFSGIVTLGTKFDWTPEVAASAAGFLVPETIREKVPKFAAALAARHADAGGWEVMLQRTAALLRELGEAPLLTTAALQRVTIPVCIAAGTRDDNVSPAEGARIAATLPNAFHESLLDVLHPIERVPAGVIRSLMRRVMNMP
ncbi:MAG TPA: alpha/beta fold hydrolase [Gemmatimonas sp.]|nr:alpha/beta fold hydrolase [Gemmatimonas sp.]